MFEEESESVISQESVEEMLHRFKQLEIDIEHIDVRMNLLQNHIVELESTLDRLKFLIKNEQNNQTKLKLYQTRNYNYEQLWKVQQLYQTYVFYKYHYRREQDDLTYKKIRLIEYELKKKGGDHSELTPTKLLSLLQLVSGKIDNNLDSNEEFKETLNELDNNDLYKL